ncbi:MAG TPA: hypothetical protein PKN13_11810 [Accumulibacter sp.]|nr:hypothetical protein [Accumulibacter sp.]HMW17910.1 hypothetical protein [Accumulibacter sp.]HMX23185.1 hypothetical protein [Accumulibacter sp.]HNC16789.1 hypothetical protein [Accumulibacter sp.]HNE13679.1 hypothetical protein [Accumulibacter sp.]
MRHYRPEMLFLLAIAVSTMLLPCFPRSTFPWLPRSTLATPVFELPAFGRLFRFSDRIGQESQSVQEWFPEASSGNREIQEIQENAERRKPANRSASI